MFRRIVVLLALALVHAPVAAEWYEASSDHFVIYADDREKDVRQFAENLERYHAAMAYLTRREGLKPSPSNRVTIFVVGGQKDIRELMGTKSRSIAGFYTPRASGSKAFVQDVRLTNGYPDFSLIILLHEYAHHFLIGNSKFTMPRWQSEGAAEFFASAVFDRDGSVSIGRPAEHRFREIAYADPVSLEELFDYDLYDRRKKSSNDSFYGQSWLLYHYLSFSDEREGQLADYQVKIANGMTSIDAAREVFGDFKQLDRELSAYKRKSSMLSYNLSPDKIKIGDIAIRALSEGEAAMMPVRIRSQRGVDREQALALLPEARAIAAEYPDDPGVLTALAEAEFDAGNDAEAIAAADKAIAADPARKNAYVQKGYALFRLADDAEDEVAAMKRAMAPFSALNKLENDHPLPLIFYYRSFAERGVEPTRQAKLALIRASELAPFDQGLRFQVGMMHAADGRIDEARYTLFPLANDPHRGRLSRTAQRIVAALESAEEGKPFTPAALLDDPAGDDEEEGSDPRAGK